MTWKLGIETRADQIKFKTSKSIEFLRTVEASKFKNVRSNNQNGFIPNGFTASIKRNMKNLTKI